MSSLFVYHESSPELPNKVLSHAEDITSTLAEHGVGFERWQAATPTAPGTGQDDVISAYRVQIDTLMTERGYAAVDVISLNGNPPQTAEWRAGFLDEHRQAQDASHYFVAGRGLVTLHIDEYVYALVCEKNDLITIPAGTRHWIDIGENPHLVAIRLFRNPQGWVAEFTGDKIASHFPPLDDL
jgi:1,2-dihydroxy-3-keto-5-methylthiopentene dioxygenase